MNGRIFLLICVSLALAGCTPKVWEVDARLGVHVDSGFYAYYTAAPAVDPQEVEIFIASADSVTGAHRPLRDPQERIYPMGIREKERVIVRPAQVARILATEQMDYVHSDSTVEIGYFCRLVMDANGGLGQFVENEERITPRGWIWCDPDEDLERKIAERMEDCVAVAAGYGAEALIDIMVFRPRDTNFLYGPPGYYIYGKAVVGVVAP
ncbi:MAG: hypothetical protein GY838_17295 [bacterium]|nr:hypothetical protein [bacterium]